ncbi:MAG TPA: thioredoxin-disulfide reductase, partial [Erythrobacter sp.]|nr:thioredoxin-disulfide reductase [Erythrobacter sp.]
MAALHNIGSECSYAAGEVVVEAGDPMDRFVYVLEGEIEVVDPWSRERLMDSSLGP